MKVSKNRYEYIIEEDNKSCDNSLCRLVESDENVIEKYKSVSKNYIIRNFLWSDRGTYGIIKTNNAKVIYENS